MRRSQGRHQRNCSALHRDAFSAYYEEFFLLKFNAASPAVHFVCQSFMTILKSQSRHMHTSAISRWYKQGLAGQMERAMSTPDVFRLDH